MFTFPCLAKNDRNDLVGIERVCDPISLKLTPHFSRQRQMHFAVTYVRDAPTFSARSHGSAVHRYKRIVNAMNT